MFEKSFLSMIHLTSDKSQIRSKQLSLIFGVVGGQENVHPWPRWKSIVFTWPIPSAGLQLGFSSRETAEIPKVIGRVFQHLYFSFHTSYTPQFMKWTARKSGSVVKPPALSHVSLRNPLVSVYPDFHLLPGPNGQVSWEDKGVWEELLESTPCSEESTHFTISPSSSCCLDSSLLPSNRWSLHLNGPSLLRWTEVLVCCRLLPVTCNNR